MNKTVPYGVLDFIECAISIDLGAAECSKIIKHYTGDDFTNKVKEAIADSCIDAFREGSPINTHKINKLIRVLKL